MAKQLLKPGGFTELTPEKQVIENNIKDIIRSNYGKYWYVNIETPAVESNNVLKSKWWDEVSKQIMGIYGLAQWWDDTKNYSLHFDLTVPLARYVVDHEENLKFPFKRYQIQKVWRWERQQKGRYKEFIQCDIDVIDEELNINYDIEVIEALYNTLDNIFKFLNIDKKIEIHVNNKKFLDGLCTYFNLDNEVKIKLYKVLDSYYKITKDEFYWEISRLLWNNAEEFISLLQTDIDNLELEDEKLNELFNEIKEVFGALKSKWVNVKFDPYITRWLNYYTWTVFETFISDYFQFWSICNGGRFDNLVESIRKVSWWKNKGKKYEWVGGSIGLTRLFHRLIASGLINKEVPLTDIILFNVPWTMDEYKNQIVNLLRKENISTDVYYNQDKLGKQFSYAESKKIPLGIFIWDEEEKNNTVVLKDLKTRDSMVITIDNLIPIIQDKLYNLINNENE